MLIGLFLISSPSAAECGALSVCNVVPLLCSVLALHRTQFHWLTLTRYLCTVNTCVLVACPEQTSAIVGTDRTGKEGKVGLS